MRPWGHRPPFRVEPNSQLRTAGLSISRVVPHREALGFRFSEASVPPVMTSGGQPLLTGGSPKAPHCGSAPLRRNYTALCVVLAALVLSDSRRPDACCCCRDLCPPEVFVIVWVSFQAHQAWAWPPGGPPWMASPVHRSICQPPCPEGPRSLSQLPASRPPRSLTRVHM